MKFNKSEELYRRLVPPVLLIGGLLVGACDANKPSSKLDGTHPVTTQAGVSTPGHTTPEAPAGTVASTPETTRSGEVVPTVATTAAAAAVEATTVLVEVDAHSGTTRVTVPRHTTPSTTAAHAHAATTTIAANVIPAPTPTTVAQPPQANPLG